MSKNAIKLQLNSVEALERLIGGDTETELEIRHSVVQNFADRHLKAVANSATLKDACDKLSAELRSQAAKFISGQIASFQENWRGDLTNVKFKPEIVKAMLDTVKANIGSTISQVVKDAVDEWMQENDVEEVIKKRLDYRIGIEVDARVREKFEQLRKSLMS